MDFMIYCFSFAIGCAIGSFLNVCIYRLPREMSVVNPPSHCPTCGQELAWYDNVPMVSFLLLGGRCRHCGVIISGRYALVEFLTGVLFLAVVYRFSAAGGEMSVEHAGAMIVVAAALVAASFIDLERQIIPDEITLPGAALGCLASVVLPGIHAAADPLLGGIARAVPGPVFGLIASVFGAAVGAGFIYLTGLAGKAIFRKDAMGLGDVKLMAMVGAFLGWRAALMSIFIGCFFGSVIGVGMLVWRRRKDTRIPFGPYLSLGVVSIMFFDALVIRAITWWQNFVGSLVAGA